jgi:uncharacterized protein (TIGR04255 family)
MAAAQVPERNTAQTSPRRLYTNPPVVEAVIDIHVEKPAGIEPGKLAVTLSAFNTGEEHRYPARQAVMSGIRTVDAATGQSTEETQDLTGYRFIGASQSEVIQVRQDGFSFSKLRPYTPWEEWRIEARRLWERYCAIAGPLSVSRIAVRYINRIELPKDAFQVEQYFRTFPIIAAAVPGDVTDFLLRAELPQPDIPGGILVISQGVLRHLKRPGISVILLDLDLWRTVRLPTEGDPLWEALESLHSRVNEAFEGCITDQTREIFD